MQTEIKTQITGAILAGGRARRMNGEDKGLILLADRPLISHVIDAFSGQVGSLLINANRNLDRYKQFGYPVIRDLTGDFDGPLAGIASCMNTATTEMMVCVPCDSPFIPDDLVERLYLGLMAASADICMASSSERTQPVFSLIRTELMDSLQKFLDSGERKIDKWYATHKLAIADFSDKPETFMNINTPEDILKATALIQSGV